jgi:hypothetical protein
LTPIFSNVVCNFCYIDNGNVDEVINEDPQVVFTMETLLAATGNFHDDNKLGEGGFGPVYKVT